MSPYSLRPVAISQPLGFYGDDDFFLDGNTPLGDEAMDASSQLLVALTTDNPAEARAGSLTARCFGTFSSCCGYTSAGDSGPTSP